MSSHDEKPLREATDTPEIDNRFEDFPEHAPGDASLLEEIDPSLFDDDNESPVSSCSTETTPSEWSGDCEETVQTSIEDVLSSTHHDTSHEADGDEPSAQGSGPPIPPTSPANSKNTPDHSLGVRNVEMWRQQRGMVRHELELVLNPSGETISPWKIAAVKPVEEVLTRWKLAESRSKRYFRRLITKNSRLRTRVRVETAARKTEADAKTAEANARAESEQRFEKMEAHHRFLEEEVPKEKLDKIKKLEQEKDRHMRLILELEEETTSERGKFEERIENLREKIKLLAKEKSEKGAELETDSVDAEGGQKSLEVEVNELKRENRTLRERLDGQSQHFDFMEDKTQSILERQDKLESILQEKRRETESMRKLIDSLDQEKTELREDFDSKKDQLEAEIRVLRQELADIRDENARLTGGWSGTHRSDGTTSRGRTTAPLFDELRRDDGSTDIDTDDTSSQKTYTTCLESSDNDWKSTRPSSLCRGDDTTSWQLPYRNHVQSEEYQWQPPPDISLHQHQQQQQRPPEAKKNPNVPTTRCFSAVLLVNTLWALLALAMLATTIAEARMYAVWRHPNRTTRAQYAAMAAAGSGGGGGGGGEDTLCVLTWPRSGTETLCFTWPHLEYAWEWARGLVRGRWIWNS